MKAIDISPLALVSENVFGDKILSSSGSTALEAVKELCTGDGQTKKGRKVQNEVDIECCYFILKLNLLQFNLRWVIF